MIPWSAYQTQLIRGLVRAIMARRKAPTAVPTAYYEAVTPTYKPKDKRLNVKRCRELVESSSQLSDEQVSAMRDQMYAFASLLFAEDVKERKNEYSTLAGTGIQSSDVVFSPIEL